MNRSPVLPRIHSRHLQHAISDLKTGMRSYQIVLQKNNYTRNLLHPPWKYVCRAVTRRPRRRRSGRMPLFIVARCLSTVCLKFNYINKVGIQKHKRKTPQKLDVSIKGCGEYPSQSEILGSILKIDAFLNWHN